MKLLFRFNGMAKVNTNKTAKVFPATHTATGIPILSSGEKIVDAANTDNQTRRGIQTMLRLTSSNQFFLSRMADNKAIILISVNTLIMTVTLAVLAQNTDGQPMLSLVVLLLCSVVTIILALIATRPLKTRGEFTKQDVLGKQTNLLFFGNFYRSKKEDYAWAMNTIMRENDYLYDTMVKDIHTSGVVLAGKFKLIRVAYNVFMFGLSVSLLTFLIEGFILYIQSKQL